MTEEVLSEQRGSRISAPIIIGVVLLLIALFAPLAIIVQNDLDYSVTQIIAITWILNFDYGQVMLGPFNNLFFFFMSMLPLTCLRYLFAYMMVNLYKGKTTRKRVLLVGIASELQFFISLLPLLMMLLSSTIDYLPIIIPIPFLLIIGLLFIRFLPPKDYLTWIEKEEQHQ